MVKAHRWGGGESREVTLLSRNKVGRNCKKRIFGCFSEVGRLMEVLLQGAGDRDWVRNQRYMSFSCPRYSEL